MEASEITSLLGSLVEKEVELRTRNQPSISHVHRVAVVAVLTILSGVFGLVKWHESGPHAGAVSKDEYVAAAARYSQSVDKLAESVDDNSRAISEQGQAMARFSALLEVLIANQGLSNREE